MNKGDAKGHQLFRDSIERDPTGDAHCRAHDAIEEQWRAIQRLRLQLVALAYLSQASRQSDPLDEEPESLCMLELQCATFRIIQNDP